MQSFFRYNKAVNKNKEASEMKAIQIGKENFDKVQSSERPVLLDFYAEWCGPCRAVLPKIDEIAMERPDLFVAKVNVESEKELAERFGIMSIPTLVLIKNGKELRRIKGSRAKAEILDFALSGN